MLCGQAAEYNDVISNVTGVQTALALVVINRLSRIAGGIDLDI